MRQGVFVAGTDTGVGKTLIASALLHAYVKAGLKAVGMKPVSAGCDERGHNEDVEALRAAGNVEVSADQSCVYLLDEAIAPHIAAKHEGKRIDLRSIERAYATLRAHADCVVVEGVGGFRVPLNEIEDAADMAQRLALPVVLVVGMRLGCLNHALLTQEAIEARGLRLAGWVANRMDPHMLCFEENLEALKDRLAAPLLAEVPYRQSPNLQEVAGLFDLKSLAHT
ncbi:MAG TPA: dethiobiotin synthase [Burkholderiales bacterium]|nr:dethiobiotin synthase [Burkholderiales bacterium]